MAGKVLYRSTRDRMISGVCGGLADYLGLDPTVIRVIAVLAAALSAGGALIAYFVLWAVVPEYPDQGEETSMTDQDREQNPADAESVPAPAQPAPVQPAPAQISPARPAPPPRHPATVSRGPLWVGLVLVFIGVGLLAQMFLPGLRLWQFWPVVFIVWGILVIVRARGRG